MEVEWFNSFSRDSWWRMNPRGMMWGVAIGAPFLWNAKWTGESLSHGLVPFGFWSCPVVEDGPLPGPQTGLLPGGPAYLRFSVTRAVDCARPLLVPTRGPGAAGRISVEEAFQCFPVLGVPGRHFGPGMPRSGGTEPVSPAWSQRDRVHPLPGVERRGFWVVPGRPPPPCRPFGRIVGRLAPRRCSSSAYESGLIRAPVVFRSSAWMWVKPDHLGVPYTPMASASPTVGIQAPLFVFPTCESPMPQPERLRRSCSRLLAIATQ